MIDPAALLDLSGRLGVAVVIGAVVGLVRQWRLSTAGMRTNALVSLGAALFVVLGAESLTGPGADPTRVAAQIASGIGFLGAGVIIRDGLKVRGVTTAATLWCSAAIGSVSGAGQQEVAVLGAVAVVCVNLLLRPLSHSVSRRLAPPAGVGVGVGVGELVPVAEVEEYGVEVVTTGKNAFRVQGDLVQGLIGTDFDLTGLDVQQVGGSHVRMTASVHAQGELVAAQLELFLRALTLDSRISSSRWWHVRAG